MPIRSKLLLLLGIWATLAAAASADPPPSSRLGGPELTPVGAERAGNGTGTIPPWTGGILAPPAGFTRGQHHLDPFGEDEPLYRITAANLADHESKLSEGQKALLRANPDTFWIDVYPTRRSASYPPFVYEAMARNADTAKLSREGKGGVTGFSIGAPFPIPSDGPDAGLEVVWNHLLRFRGQRVVRIQGSAAVSRAGLFNVTLARQDYLLPYAFPAGSPIRERFPNVLFAARGRTFAPALLSGNGTLAIEPIDQTHAPRRVWTFNRALRRIIRQPYFAYEFTSPGTDGLRTVDDGELFNGPPDRFDWTLLGKREMLIPYNAYRLHSSDVSERTILERRHIAPSLSRYELHRVWVVEGRLREGARHIYSRRVFYVDEDSWQIATADVYDLEERLWRVQESHAVNYYEVPVHWTTLLTYYDLRARRYFVTGLDNGRDPYEFSDEADPREFSPIALNFYVR